MLAANRLAPTHYAQDVFFLFGSQDSFNLFSPLFAALMAWLGGDLASRALTLGGGLLWIVAWTYLAHAAFGATLAARALVLLAAPLALSYSPNFDTFVLNETFATARIISIPLSLIALAARLDGRLALAWVVAFVATALHPLLGIWGLAALISSRWPAPRLWLAAGIAITLLGSVAALSITPPLALLDPEWEATLRSSTRDLFVGPLGTARVGAMLFWIAALWSGVQLGTKRLRRLYRAAAILTVGGLAVAAIASFWLPVELVVQAQPWRVLWLAICLGLVALVDASSRLLRRPGGPWLLLLVSVATYLFDDARALVLALAAWTLSRRGGICVRLREQTRKFPQVLPALSIAAGLCAAPAAFSELESLANGLVGFWGNCGIWIVLLGGGGVSVLFWAVALGYRAGRVFALLIGLPLLLVAFAQWDKRPEHARVREASYLLVARDALPLGGVVSPGSVVHWPGRDLDVWFRLGAANYASEVQAVGMVFSAAKARVITRRLTRASIAVEVSDATARSPRHNQLRYSPQPTPMAAAPPLRRQGTLQTLAAVAFLCADPVLDWVVIDATRSSQFRAGEFWPLAIDGHWLFPCAKVRAANGGQSNTTSTTDEGNVVVDMLWSQVAPNGTSPRADRAEALATPAS